VFGMPRSGTTLVEQIIASHPMVHGTGETPYFDTIARTSIISDPSSGLTPDNLTLCGNRYLELIDAQVPAAMRFVDKTNSNFQYAGPISLLFPGARMIHCRRDPLDTCLSCFSRVFTGNQPFAYDLGELGRYYRAYADLMAHWRGLLPAGVMLELQYEALVGDLEPQARRLLAHCGLAWDPACLEFHATERVVRTASLVQVRQPLYRDSLGRAARYRRLLGPLLDALGDATGDLASG